MPSNDSISVKAVGDGVNYATSDAGTLTTKTSAAIVPPTTDDIVASGTLTSGKTDLVLESGKAITYSEIKKGQNYAEYTNPARFYGSNQVVVSSSAGAIKKIVVACTSADYATVFENSVKALGSTTKSGNTVTLTLTTPSTTVSWTNTAQWRANTMTVTYSSTSGDETEGGGETPDPNPEPTTYTYTFTSKAWADATSSWTSGKDGGQMQSGRGVQVSTTYTGANATCKTSMSNIQKVVFVYSTNSSNGAGSIKVSIGNQEKTLSVTKTGGTSDRNLEFDFSDSPLSGQLKFTVTCTTNSIYIKSVSITAD